jgi:XTP/dITP diphosphohydrolase
MSCSSDALARRLLFATTNRDKVREIAEVLAGIPYELVTLEHRPHLEPPPETARTFIENARDKARYYAAATGELTVAEDSGLEIDALDGAPGVESARFGGPTASYPQKFALIYEALRAKAFDSAQARTSIETAARFVCALALVIDERVLFETTAFVQGRISPVPRGSGGFGYDPIFFCPSFGRTLAEVSVEEKAHVSHRGQAFRALRRFLENHPQGIRN